jgi:Ca2+-binding RTX toxin-like protein
MESAGAATGVGNGGQNLLVGNSFDNVLDGGANNDQLEGGGGNDTLQGGTGNDGMIGGAGNDTYFVDSVFDVIVENPGEGIDTVYTNSNYAVGANVEQLYLMESAGAATGVGNGEQNLLVGNSFDNVLDGGANNDQLEGGGGNDTLEGGAGNDGMIGGTGNDTYFVDSVFDVIVENAGEGIDTVYTNSNYIIGANVEQLYLMESAGAATGVGNGEQNLLVGNSFDNALDGGGGNDTLQGGGGDDTLFGGTGIDGLQGDAGNDNFVFNPGTAAGDVIVDFDGNGAGAGDHLSFVGFGAGATFTQQDATHWVLTYNGGANTEVITFQNAATIHVSDFLFL